MGDSGSNKKRLLSKEESKFQVVWMRHTEMNFYIYAACCLFSAGIVYIWCLLYPSWKEWFLCSQCTPEVADSVAATIDKVLKVVPINRSVVNDQQIISIEVSCKRYYTTESDGWDFLSVPDVPLHFSQYLKPTSTQSKIIANRETLKSLYGTNKMELPTASFWDILTVTIFHPFYLFQYFAVVIWMIEDYVLYSCVILLTTGGAIYATTTETMFNLRRLHDLAGASSTITLLKENGERVDISDRELVPGDRFLIKFGTSLPCDAVLIAGRVSVDESMLTGESVPVNKTPVELSVFQNTNDSEEMVLSKLPGNVLFSGTKVLLASGTTNEESSGDCIAVAYKTGFRSAKGQLISTLLNPKENFMSFFSDALWVILFMAVLCTSLYIWSAVYLRENQASWGDICIKYLDAITIAVPPALTASLSVATGISINRLRNRDIYVSESTRVNWAGIVGFAAFDKTGTLTEERLHFKGVSIPQHLAELTNSNSFFYDSARGDSSTSVEMDSHSTAIPLPCIELMATCHALAIINGVPVGDPLEVEMFRASGFSMNADPAVIENVIMSVYSPGPPLAANKYDILRHFEFTSDRARAGSLVKRPNHDIIYYSKGSPEAILKLVDRRTIPTDIHQTLNVLSKRGLRVLAMAYKVISNDESSVLDVTKFSQIELETSSIFLGLVFLSNALKAETLSTINALRNANIKCNMITGDHIHTAIAIATDCGLLVEGQEVYIIDTASDSVSGLNVTVAATGDIVTTNVNEFINTKHHSQSPNQHHHTQIAITGQGLEVIKSRHSYMMKILLESTQVFARMKPSDKQFIVEQLQHLTEKDAKDIFTDDDARISTNNDMVQISSDLPSPISNRFRKSLLDNVALMMDEDGRGDLHVIFCGDGILICVATIYNFIGANDMAALRAATVGVSLCEAETSVAAPVTSRLQTPGAVVEVIKEGRCSLITAYVLVAFNIMYGTIQLFMAIMMYNYGLELGNNTYLIQDLFYTLILGLAISITPPSETLSKELPPQRFFTKYFCFKLFSQLICFPIFQLIALEALRRQSWYEKYDFGDDPLSETYAYETSVIASIGLAQVMIASIVSTIDEPFRKHWYTNKYHVMALVFQAGFLLYQIFGRKSYFMKEILEIRPLKIGFCWILIVIILANCVVSVLLSRMADLIKHLSQRNIH